MMTAPMIDLIVSRLMNGERFEPPVRAAATTFLVSVLCCFSLFVDTDVCISGWVSMRS
jgi:hypothetical protein